MAIHSVSLMDMVEILWYVISHQNKKIGRIRSQESQRIFVKKIGKEY